MSEVFDIQLPDGRVVGIQANSPEEAARGAKNILAREQGEQRGKEGGVLPYVDNLVRQAANGMTFGYADEIAAALDSLVGRAGSYDEGLAQNRAQDKAFADQNPLAAGAANIAGNVATAALTLPAAATAMGPSLGMNVLKSGAVGAGMGGVQGFGEGEGGFVDRATHGVISAGLGAAGGALAPVAGAAASRAMESAPGRWLGQNVIAPGARMIGEAVGKPVPPASLSAAAPDGAAGSPSVFQNVAERFQNPAQRGAVERLATAGQREGMTADDIVARTVAKLDELGPQGVLADAGTQFRTEAERAYNLPGQTRTIADTVLKERTRGRGDRMVADFNGSEPAPSAKALRGEGGAFEENARAVGNRAYDAMDQAGLKQSPELMALYENEFVDRAINKVMDAESKTRVGTSRAPASPVDIMHKVKQEIQDMGVASTGRGDSTQSYFRDLAGEYVRALKAANPELAHADTLYRQAKSLPEYFDVGAALLRKESPTSQDSIEKSAAALADLLSKAETGQQTLAARTGATNAARAEAEHSSGSALSLARRIDTSNPVRSKIDQLYGPEWGDAIKKGAAREVTFAETEQGIRGNSASARRLADMIDQGFDLGNAGVRLGTGGASPRMFEYLKDIPKRLMAPNEAVRDEIGRISLSQNPEERRRILALAAELMRDRQRGARGDEVACLSTVQASIRRRHFRGPGTPHSLAARPILRTSTRCAMTSRRHCRPA